ncbi:hypothetical protein [Aureimonas glaciei]|uniref:Uncharacterized protein n=1 Tax=Aureimonas glaciei TaxID=1776957 RepID=A0A916YFQ1_9HYPH|nr:hypothetical protein [Aureimonas glaciei]GGD43089.1 hypothetical protein GCM10011335_52180 [Aureimonas glaciei]
MSAVRELDLGNGRSDLSIVKAVEANPVLVLVDEAKFDELYAEMMREVKAFVPDLGTATGRKEIASLAFKVTRTKTAIDAAGKKLNEDARKQINVVDASRRTIRDKLDALADQVRKPLTDWEAAEKRRVDDRQAEIDDLDRAAMISTTTTAAEIEKRIADLTAVDLSPATMQEFAPRAVKARDAALSILSTNLERIKREEADRAELARLRAEAAAREQAEAEHLATEQAERRRVEREQAEAELRARAAEEERERIAAAEERARREAVVVAERQQRESEEAAARREREAAAAHAAEIARIRRQQEDFQRETNRVAEAQAAAARAEREEAERRAADREHRGKIMGEAKAAFIDFGISETKAKAIVLAVAAGSVPHVSIRF